MTTDPTPAMPDPEPGPRPAARDVQTATAIMRAFAERTRIASPDGGGHRYLWTDAFAVCNFLSLHRATGSQEHLTLARSLVARVHEELGRHRADDPRRGWLSGLPEREGRLHPTRGGLRIGKPLPERRAGEPPDERLEWDRDGQYFHYLTRWVHALLRMARATGEVRYLQWALELAEAAHAAFVWVHPDDGRRRLYWKMSVDLSRPLVASMGHHDPLDAALTWLELQAAAAAAGLDGADAGLVRMLADVHDAASTTGWTTGDPLGLGGLLTGAHALAQLAARGAAAAPGSLAQLLEAAAAGIDWLRARFPAGPASQRLAFRELGLAIGLRAVPRIAALAARHHGRLGDAAVERALDRLRRQLPLGDTIERFWLDAGNQTAPTWTEHRDINAVMLATSLVPDVYLEA